MAKKFSFLDYLCEIWTVATVRWVDVHVAFLRFAATVNSGKREPYNIGSELPDFDFLPAKELWDALSTDEQNAAYVEFLKFVDDRYSEACELYPDREKLKELVGAWRAKHVEG